jgi:hypothetical protein
LVVSTSPLDSATDVAVDSNITFTFNTALLRSTVNEATVLLYDDATAEPVQVNVSLSSDGTVITAIPLRVLAQEKTYVAAVIGASDNLAGGNIKSSDSTDLADTYQISFRTRVERFVRLTEIAERDDIETVGPIRETSDLAEVTGYLEILETTPAGFESNVDNDLSEIVVLFDQDVLASGSNDALELVMSNVLGLDEYYGAHDGTGVILKDWLDWETDNRNSLFYDDQVPSGTIVFDGDEVKWVKASGAPDFHYNTEVTVRVRADSIVNATGHMLADDVYFTFTTEYFPCYVGVEYIRLQLGRAVADLFDDTIRRHIHAASIDAVDHAAGMFIMEHPYPAVRRYVRSTAILAILDEIGLLPALRGGQTKRLGDFQVQYSPQDLAKVMSAYKRAVKEQEATLKELRAYRRQSRPKYVVKGSENLYERRDFRMRTWQHLRNTRMVASNTYASRRIKSAYGADHPSMFSESAIAWIGIIDEERVEGVSFPWW